MDGKRTFFYLFNFILFALLNESCKEKKNHLVYTSNDFTKEIKIYGVTMGLKKSGPIVDIAVIPSSNLLLTSSVNEKFFLSAFTLDSLKFIRSFAVIGEKENELLDAQNIQIDTSKNVIYIADLVKHAVFTYSIDSINATSGKCFPIKTIPIKSENPGRSVVLQNSKIVALRSASTKGVSNLDFYDQQGQYLYSKGDYPNPNLKFADHEFAEIYLGFLTLSKDGQRIIRSYLSTDIIDIYDTSGNLLKRIQVPDNFGPEFKRERISSVISHLKFKKNARLAFSGSLREGGDILALYSGEYLRTDTTQASFLFQFSDTLRPKIKYMLDIPLICFDIDWSKKIVYGISQRNPDKLIRYKLPE